MNAAEGDRDVEEMCLRDMSHNRGNASQGQADDGGGAGDVEQGRLLPDTSQSHGNERQGQPNHSDEENCFERFFRSVYQLVCQAWKCLRVMKKTMEDSLPVKIFMLGLAFYMFADQVFDGMQSYTYFIHSLAWNEEWPNDELELPACDEAQLKECWDYIHNTTANHNHGDFIQTDCGKWSKTTETMSLNCKLLLHRAYFDCSLCCWLLPPMVFGTFLTYMKCEGMPQTTSTALCIGGYFGGYTFLWFADVLLGFLVVYAKLTIDAVLSALSNLKWISKRRTEYDQHWTFLKFESNLALELQTKILKLLEQIWEALPQLVLGLTFYMNNYYYIKFSEPGFPKTVISIALSMGSVSVGICTGLIAARDVAFINSVKNGKVKWMTYLLKLGADPNMDVSKDVTAIEYAMENGVWKSLDCLVEAGARAKQDKCDKQLLLESEKGQLVGVKSLIKAGGAVNTTDESGSTPIHLASKNGYVDVVNTLIEENGDVNPTNNNGSTPIYLASGNGHVEVVSRLLLSGANPKIQNKDKDTPLQTATKQMHAEVVGCLVGALAAVDKEDLSDEIPIQWASKDGQTELVNRLLEVKGDILKAAEFDQWEIVEFLDQVGCEVTIEDEDRYTKVRRVAFINSVKSGIAKRIKLLLKLGADPKIDVSKDMSAIEHTIKNEFWEALDCLVEAGARVNKDISYCNEQLHKASKNGQVEVVNAWIKVGGNVKIQNIQTASKQGHEEVVACLITAITEVRKEEHNGEIPIVWATKEGQAELVKGLIQAQGDIVKAAELGRRDLVEFLIQAGVDVKVQNQMKETPLQTASKHGHKEVVGYLVSALTEIIKEDQSGNTPIHWTSKDGQEELVKCLIQDQGDIVKAAENGHMEVVNTLVQAGGEVNIQNEMGSTPLHLSSENGHVEVIFALLVAGADKRIRNRNGKTPHDVAKNQDCKNALYPLHAASENGQVEVVGKLIQAGGDVNEQNEWGFTPLHWASGSGHVEVITALLAAGADKTIKTNGGQTPHDVAKNQDCKNALE